MKKHSRRSIRLPEYDYGQPGAYFVTICVEGRKPVLGEVINGEMKLSQTGRIAAEVWSKIPEIYSQINIDTYCVMPNHVHAIISIGGIGRGEVPSPTPQQGGETPPLRNVDLGKVVAFYKYETTKTINDILNSTSRKF